MKTIDEHRTKLREIADFAFGYGVKSIGIKAFHDKPFNSWNKGLKRNFRHKCHEGFKMAQRLIVEEVKDYQSLHREKTNLLKEFRRQKDKIKEKDTSIIISIIEQRLHTLSHIADGIAWQLIGGQIHIARRLHIEQNKSKFLDNSNIESAILVSENINKNLDDFALISDLTSFVQIGDLLIRHNESLEIAEIKEGSVNKKILDFLKTVEQKEEILEEDLIRANLDSYAVKQMERILRQEERATRAKEVINKDKGIDPVSGKDIKVHTPTINTEYYYEELHELYLKLKTKTWAYTNVDACLHIGMYRDESLIMSGFAIKQILKEETENYIVIDWLSITQSVSEPIFMKPFPPDFIIDILTGKIKVIIGLNFDTLIEIFNSFGLVTRWLTKKETAIKKQESIRKGMVIINKRGIVITSPNNEEMIVYGGLITKILYDNIKPINIALSVLSNVNEKTE